MTKQLKMLAGVAMLAILALAGTLGVFAFSDAQSVEAQDQAAPMASRSFSPMTVAPGGTVKVTITTENIGSDLTGNVTEMLPSGFSYVTSSLPADNVNTEDSSAPVFSLFGAPSTFTYDVTASMTEVSHTFSGTLSTRSIAVEGSTLSSPVTCPCVVTVSAADTTPTAAASVKALAQGPGRGGPDYRQVPKH